MGLLLFLLYISELFSILENKLIGDAVDSALMVAVQIPRRFSYSSRAPDP